jgi:hypothetical protein
MKQFILVCLIALLAAVGTVSAAGCGVDVYGLTVSADSRISANIKNLGNAVETIFYNFYVNGVSIIGDPEIRLNPGETKQISYAYSFSAGVYDVGVSAISACGATDTETLKHTVLERFACRNPLGQEGQDYCNPTTRSYFQCVNGRWELKAAGDEQYCRSCNTCNDGVLNCGETRESCPQDAPQPARQCEEKPLASYKCSGSVRQQEFQNTDCSKNWVSLDYCPYGCTEGICRPFKELAEEEEKKPEVCGVGIQNVYYATNIVAGTSSTISIEILNTANEIETIEILLYVDGSVQKRLTVSAAPNARIRQPFEYSVQNPGWHALSFEVRAENSGCKSSDFFNMQVYSLPRAGAIETQKPGTAAEPCAYSTNIYSQAYQTYCKQGTKPETIPQTTETSVHVYPIEVDSYVSDSSVITVDMKTAKPQSFSISVAGIPYSWVKYDSTVYIEKQGRSYIYLTPKTAGKTDAVVFVSAAAEGKIFSQKIDIFALKREVKPASEEPFITGQVIYRTSLPAQAPAFGLYTVYEIVSYLLILLFLLVIPFSLLVFVRREKEVVFEAFEE